MITVKKMVQRNFWAILVPLLGYASLAVSQTPHLPLINWLPQGDWINVKSAPYNAVGNGTTDDANAINAAFAALTNGKVVYFPAGTYRITKQLTIGQKEGIRVLGCGRTTTILWDGTTDSVMIWPNGTWNGEFNGIIWNGNNKAKIGFLHRSATQYEGNMRHENEAFMNFTQAGIRTALRGETFTNPSAESEIRNCLFVNCNYGVRLLYFNYFNWSISGCEFRNCGVGVNTKDYGYAWIYFCHFENNTRYDVELEFAADNSVRWCTSKGSRRFAWVQDICIEDCIIENVQDKDSAVILNSSRAPFVMSDLYFTNWNSPKTPLVFSPVSPHDPDYAPVELPQQLIYSNIQCPGASVPVSGGLSTATKIQVPVSNKRQTPMSGMTSATSFFKESVVVPTGTVYNIKTEGATGNGTTDDYTAIQGAIDKARIAGHGAWVYVPTGNYKISKPLTVSGSDYFIMGNGPYSIIAAPTGVVGMLVTGTSNVVISRLQVGVVLASQTAVRLQPAIMVAGTATGSSVTFDRVTVASSGYPYFYLTDPANGLVMQNLTSKDTVHVVRLTGALRAKNSSEGIVLADYVDGGAVVVEGTTPKTGLFGIVNANSCWYTVRNSQNFIGANLNQEQPYSPKNAITPAQHSLLLLEGTSGDAAGRVTFGGSKVWSTESDTFYRVRNYKGTFVYWNTDFSACYGSATGAEGEQRLIISQTGDNPIWMIYAAIQWPGDMGTADPYLFPPRFSINTTVVKSALVQTKWFARDVFPGGDTAGTLNQLSQSLDDFRTMAEHVYKLNWKSDYSAGVQKSAGLKIDAIMPRISFADKHILAVYPGMITMELFDASGRLINRIFKDKNDRIVMPMPDRTGVYVVRLTSANGIVTRKIVVNH